MLIILAKKVYAYLPIDANKNTCDTKKYPLNNCRDAEYGASLGRTAFKFQTGAWNRLALHVQVNEIGKTNGLVQVYHNDKKVIDIKGMTFRTNVAANSLLVTDLLFSTFFGGATVPYAAPIDTFVLFRNVNMSIANTPYVPPNDSAAAPPTSMLSYLLAPLLSFLMALVYL